MVVTKLDRLARSTLHLGEIIEVIHEKESCLQILNLGINTSSATGEIAQNLLGAVVQFERQMMQERQREGIAKAKSEGKYQGRRPTARAKSDEMLGLKAQWMNATAIAKELGIGRASVYRILND